MGEKVPEWKVATQEPVAAAKQYQIGAHWGGECHRRAAETANHAREGKFECWGS